VDSLINELSEKGKAFKTTTLAFSYLHVIRKLFCGFECYVKDIVKDEWKGMWKETILNYFNYQLPSTSGTEKSKYL
jgi:hypothetical protein